MNLKYMKVSLFEITYKKNELFHDILIYWDAPVFSNVIIHMMKKLNFLQLLLHPSKINLENADCCLRNISYYYQCQNGCAD